MSIRDIQSARPGHDHVTPDTFAAAMIGQAMTPRELRKRHGVVVQLGRGVLGETPDAYALFALDEESFRWYVLCMGTCLHFPAPLRERGIGSIMTEGMAWGSHAGGSQYCSIHSCNVALRNGVAATRIERLQALPIEQKKPPQSVLNQYSAAEQAVILVAAAMGPEPPQLDDHLCWNLRQKEFTSYSRKDQAQLIDAISFMGALNGTNEGLGVAPEAPLIASMLQVMKNHGGWKPRRVPRAQLAHIKAVEPPRYGKYGWLRLAPYAAVEEAKSALWKRGIPGGRKAVVSYLRHRVGYGWPGVLDQIPFAKVRRSVACVLRNAHTPKRSPLPMRAKLMAAARYAELVGGGDAYLMGVAETLAAFRRVDLGTEPETPEEVGAVKLAEALATRRIGVSVVQDVSELLTAQQIMHQIAYHGYAQRMMGRYESWYRHMPK
ncbi:MAG: hypothetical protein ACRDJ9_07465 [Dehalococcoidia bacterium]